MIDDGLHNYTREAVQLLIVYQSTIYASVNVAHNPHLNYLLL